MIRINEIVTMNKGTLAIIFTDDRSGQRDVTFFKDIATEEDISELEVYTPKPTGDAQVFHFVYFVNKPPKIGLFMGKITTFERIGSVVRFGLTMIRTISSVYRPQKLKR